MFRFPRSRYPRPICRMYGVDRSFKYKGYFFCSNCKTVDDSLTTKGMIRSSFRADSKYHHCEARHNCYAFPTDKGPLNSKHVHASVSKDLSSSLLMRQRIQVSASSLSSSCGSSFLQKQKSTPSIHGQLMNEVSNLEERLCVKQAELETVQEELVSTRGELFEKTEECNATSVKLQKVEDQLDYTITSLMEKEKLAEDLVQENKDLRELVHQLQVSLENLRNHLRLSNQQSRRDRQRLEDYEDQSTESLVQTVCDLLALITNTKRCSHEKKASAFADLLLNGSMLDGALSDRLRKKLMSDIRSTVFSAPALIKKMDECGFTLNYAALNAVHSMEKAMCGKYTRGLFPSTATIKRKMKIVHIFGDHVLPFSLSRFPDELGGGELAKFPQELVLKAALKSHGLFEKAKSERVGVGYAYDGTKIDSRTYLEISGFKITDCDAKDPKTGRLLYSNGLQSSACSFPDTLGIAKDTKEVFELYKPRFERVAAEAEERERPMLGQFVDTDGVRRDFKHVQATSEMDMKTVWMINGVGCAAKQGGDNIMFCSFCPLTNRQIATGSRSLCHRWCRQFGRDEQKWTCHHVDMVTEEHVQNCRREVDEMEGNHSFFSELENIYPKCKLNTDEDPSLNGCGPHHLRDPSSIHFQYDQGNMAQKIQFLNSVRHDLVLRGISTDGGAREQIE